LRRDRQVAGRSFEIDVRMVQTSQGVACNLPNAGAIDDPEPRRFHAEDDVVHHREVRRD
jgi:hypothetical protein